MSFTFDVKEELAHVAPECSHCSRATLAALVRMEGTLRKSGGGGYSIELVTDVANIARTIITLLHETYGLKTDLVIRKSVLHKTNNYLVNVPSQLGLNEALLDMGVLTKDGGLQMGIRPELVEKSCCAAAYLRGAFLGSGFVSNPRSDCHFEIAVGSPSLAEGIVELFARKGINARVMSRRSSSVVYLKSGDAILSFLAYTGAHQSALEMEKQRVIKSVRNDVNRQINAEYANQIKASNAAVDQVVAMKRVAAHYGMENLPPALREVIRLRVKYPEASLKELGERSNPPLSKSAIYHRVRRIEQMAADIKR